MKEQSLTRKIYRKVKSDILQKRFSKDNFLPSEKEFMDEHGVSRTTVRNALGFLKNDGFVESRKGLGWQVKSATKVTVLYSSKQQFQIEIHEFLRKLFHENQINLNMNFLSNNTIRLSELINLADIDGLMCIGDTELDKKQLYELERRSIDTVNVNLDSDSKLNIVRPDYENDTRMLTSYLTQRGHRNILFISSNGEKNAVQSKKQAYVSFMKDNNLEPRTLELQNDLTITDIEVKGLVEAIGDLKTPITAIVGSNDQLSARILLNLSQKKVFVPGDISITGYGGLEISDILSPFSLRGLVSMKPRWEEIHRMASEKLIQLLKGEDKSPKLQVVPSEMIIGDSVARLS